MRVLALLCVLAGCFSDEAGLHIVVHDEVGNADSVDMYIYTNEASVDLLRPQLANDPMEGRVFLLDSAKPPKNHEVVNGKVVFNILAEDPDKAIDPIGVVFIGRDTDGKAVSFGKLPTLGLEAAGTATYRYDLVDAASPASAPSIDADPGGTRIFEWPLTGADPGRTKCVDVEFADPVGDTVDRYFFVPPDDRDCDGAQECTMDGDYTYEPPTSPPAAPPMDLAHAQCASRDGSTDAPMCKVGYLTPDQCDPSHADRCVSFTQPKYCAPLSICEESECFEHPLDCYIDPPAVDGTYLKCTIPVTDLGGQCAPMSNTGLVRLGEQVSILFAFPPFPECESVQAWLPGGSVGDSAPFVQVGTGASLEFGIKNVNSTGCTFTLEYEGMAASSLSDVNGGIDVKLTSGNHVVVPIRVVFTDCNHANDAGCTLEPDMNDKHSFKDCVDP